MTMTSPRFIPINVSWKEINTVRAAQYDEKMKKKFQRNEERKRDSKMTPKENGSGLRLAALLALCTIEGTLNHLLAPNKERKALKEAASILRLYVGESTPQGKATIGGRNRKMVESLAKEYMAGKPAKVADFPGGGLVVRGKIKKAIEKALTN